MLTGKEIAKRQIINGFEEKQIQQQGIDVRVERIYKVSEYMGGIVPEEGKTIIPNTTPRGTTIDHDGGEWFQLQPGYYEVEFIEGCDIPADCCMQFKTRSSLVRCGCEVRSGLFDAGFKTEHMGAFLKVELPVEIERGARIAQVIVEGSNIVENLYDGQFQGDKQRKE